MAVHGVSLALVPEEAGSGGEPGILAAVHLAAVGLEVGVHKLAVREVSKPVVLAFKPGRLTRSCT